MARSRARFRFTELQNHPAAVRLRAEHRARVHALAAAAQRAALNMREAAPVAPGSGLGHDTGSTWTPGRACVVQGA